MRRETLLQIQYHGFQKITRHHRPTILSPIIITLIELFTRILLRWYHLLRLSWIGKPIIHLPLLVERRWFVPRHLLKILFPRSVSEFNWIVEQKTIVEDILRKWWIMRKQFVEVVISGGEPKGRKIAQSIPTKMQRNIGENNPSKDTSVDEFIPSRPSTLEKDKEQMILLQEQVDNLQKKVLEKDELLKSAETSMNQMNVVHAKVDELKRQIAEKETLIKSAHLQLSDARVKLADKQATLEKIQWEATTSNKKVEELQDEMESVQGEKAAFMLLFESLTSDDCTGYAENYDVFPSYSDQLPSTDDISETEMLEMEEARQAYISALAAAKENQDEDLLAIATQARVRLQSFLRSESSNSRSFLRSESSNNRNMSVY